MANATANVQLNVTGNAQQQLQKIQKSVSGLQSSFGSLRNALGGVAFGAFFTNVLRSADAIDDLSKATGLSIATIKGFGDALNRSGGDATDAANLLGKFSQSLEELKEGSLESEYTLDQLGLTIEQIRSLSDEDALRTILESLAKMPAGAERTALAMKLLGKNAKSIDWTNLNGSLEQFINKAKQAEPGTKALADLYDNLQGIGAGLINQFTIGGQNVAQTLAKLTKNTDAIAKSLATVIELVSAFGVSLALLSLPKKATELGDFVDKLRKGEGVLGTAARGVNNLKTALQQLVALFTLGTVATKKWEIGVGLLGFALTNIIKFVGRFGGVIALITAVNLLIKKLTGDIDILGSALKIVRDILVVSLAGYKVTLEGLIYLFKQLGTLIADIFTPLKPLFERIAFALKNVFGIAIDVISNKLQQLKRFYQEVVADAEKALGINQGPVVSRTEGEGAAQAMPFNFKDERKRREELAKAQETEFEKLTKSIQNTTQAFIDQRNAQLRSLALQVQSVAMTQKEIDVFTARQDVYDSFTQQIQDYQNKISELKPEQEKLVPVYLAEIETLEKLRTEYMDLAEAAVIATDLQIQAQKDLQSELQRTFAEIQKTVALEDLRAELDLLGLQGDELERQQKIMAIQREMRDDILSTVQKLVELEQQLSQGIVDPRDYARQRAELEQQLDIARQIAEGKLAIDEEYYKAREELENSYLKGVERALEDVAEQFKPINVAQDVVKRGFDALGDAVDNFVETGKFSFKQFAASVIADIAKIVAKALVLQAIKSIFGGLGIPGLAEGGPAKAGKPYIVGEKGPELFVPKTSGTVVPNDGMKNGVATGAVNAPVTNNYNTYNINAVDAKSVAQLFAENRKVLLGTVKMAERELPYMA